MVRSNRVCVHIALGKFKLYKHNEYYIRKTITNLGVSFFFLWLPYRRFVSKFNSLFTFKQIHQHGENGSPAGVGEGVEDPLPQVHRQTRALLGPVSLQVTAVPEVKGHCKSDWADSYKDLDSQLIKKDRAFLSL